jgi:hypothetical protein
MAIWTITASNKKYSIKLLLTCPINDMLEINYESPDGKKRHTHLLNGGTGTGTLQIFSKQNQLLDDIEFYNTGCEYGEYKKTDA